MLTTIHFLTDMRCLTTKCPKLDKISNKKSQCDVTVPQHHLILKAFYLSILILQFNQPYTHIYIQLAEFPSREGDALGSYKEPKRHSLIRDITLYLTDNDPLS